MNSSIYAKANSDVVTTTWGSRSVLKAATMSFLLTGVNAFLVWGVWNERATLSWLLVATGALFALIALAYIFFLIPIFITEKVRVAEDYIEVSNIFATRLMRWEELEKISVMTAGLGIVMLKRHDSRRWVSIQALFFRKNMIEVLKAIVERADASNANIEIAPSLRRDVAD